MNPEELITRAKIQIQKRNSFFAYLSLFLKFKESKDLPEDAGMGVDSKGNCYYKKEFVEEITSGNNTAQLEGVITHEILHLALLHLLRVSSRDMQGWNFATDLVINSLLRENNFSLPDGVLMPDYNNSFNCGKKVIKDINKKTAEEVYDELPKIKVNKNYYVLANGKDKDKKLGKSFDEHIFGENLTPKERKEAEKDWLGKVSEAIVQSRMKGDVPIGLERLIGELHKEQIDWKSLLQKYIMSMLPYDYTYCLDGDTKIKTPNGTIKIKNLRKGRKVLGYKNHKIVYSEIKSKFTSQVKEKYIIKTKGGKEIICSGKHRFLTDRGYVRADNLKKTDKLRRVIKNG